MARRGKNAGGGNTPDSGYSFVCDYCEGEISQVPPPGLKWLHEMDRGHHMTSPFQSCHLCGVEIDELNVEFFKKNPKFTEAKQERQLREGTELPPELQAAKAELEKQAQQSDKLDKVVDALDKLVQIMTLQVQAQLQPAAPPVMPVLPAVISRSGGITHRDEWIAAADITMRDKPKRKILAPPAVKRRAPSTPEKSTRRAAKATAKQKPRGRK